MPIIIPAGIVPVRSLTTGQVLYGNRVSSYRWEVLAHAGGIDTLAGYLDGVLEGSASLTWTQNVAVKGTGSVKVSDLAVAAAGLMRIGQLSLSSVRLRPVLVVQGLPEIPLGVFLLSAAPEEWSGAGRVFKLELHDRATVLDQDLLDVTYTVDAATPILSAVATVIASAGESITVDATVTSTLTSAMVWAPGTSKLQIVNDLLSALNYTSLWVDGAGNFRATPYVVPANRGITYELLNGISRELIDGATSIYSDVWARDRDLFKVPNKVIAVQAATGTAPALTGTYTNTDPTSPFSFPSRGRWVTKILSGVNTPAGADAAVIAFLAAKAQASLIASSAVQAVVSVKHLPIPLMGGDVVRFANAPAGIDKRHVVTSITLGAHALGLMDTKLQEVIAL
jgi:hypothetical protein